jgi:hypothetical protein
MMRYVVVGTFLAVFLIFFGPALFAWGRNMARQLKHGWHEQEQEYETDEDEDSNP